MKLKFFFLRENIQLFKLIKNHDARHPLKFKFESHLYQKETY